MSNEALDQRRARVLLCRESRSLRLRFLIVQGSLAASTPGLVSINVRLTSYSPNYFLAYLFRYFFCPYSAECVERLSEKDVSGSNSLL